MKVILLERVGKNGHIGDEVTVKDGYARNFLLPQHKALRATEAGFDVGTQTTVDVLAAQRNLRLAETTYSGSRYDYMLNVLALKRAAGNLSEMDVMQVDSWLQQ